MKKKLAFVVATPLTYISFLHGHAKFLQDDYDVTLITNISESDWSDKLNGIHVVHIPIERKISIFRDLYALCALSAQLRIRKFDVVHSVSPKAGLIAAIAGWLARVPVRIHSFTGQVWATRTGLSRSLLKSMDKVTHLFTTQALSDSKSQAEFLKSEGFRKPIEVLGDGAICGIDTERFHPNVEKREKARAQYGWTENDFVFVFLGRLNLDKGILDLVKGFVRARLDKRFKLMIVGPDEGQMVAKISTEPLARSGQIVLTGHTSSPEYWLAAGDVMCLPSYREGFGMSVLEAAAVGLPAVVSRIYGLTDAVLEEKTGIMHEAGNVQQIADCLQRFVSEPNLHLELGSNARLRVFDEFSQRRVSLALKEFYAHAGQ